MVNSDNEAFRFVMWKLSHESGAAASRRASHGIQGRLTASGNFSRLHFEHRHASGPGGNGARVLHPGSTA
jgi:hypothetical protein